MEGKPWNATKTKKTRKKCLTWKYYTSICAVRTRRGKTGKKVSAQKGDVHFLSAALRMIPSSINKQIVKCNTWQKEQAKQISGTSSLNKIFPSQNHNQEQKPNQRFGFLFVILIVINCILFETSILLVKSSPETAEGAAKATPMIVGAQWVAERNSQNQTSPQFWSRSAFSTAFTACNNTDLIISSTTKTQTRKEQQWSNCSCISRLFLIWFWCLVVLWGECVCREKFSWISFCTYDISQQLKVREARGEKENQI